ncbi:APC family permease [Altererythrobacter ishigakiensis]|uniref:Arginine/agmatine antiporter n=1 Tax=Altererythrobacter ishigakiensis TaxID=476157 RepID=A0A562UTL3_9SPHN|nr:APC family permease [Altererythrobacter ishigakiensis]TWJ08960.1 amino acid/polyamine/organocation transporter (APC superfamily) [Altererythrobacter ishigakiensis]
MSQTQLATPPRAIGLAGAVLININAAIGAGIFALPALLYAGAGSFAPVAIIGFALAYACLASIVAKLSTMFEQSGGPQLYAEHVFGRFVGFQVGWFVVCANFAGRAANFHVLVAYLAALFPVFGGDVVRPVTVIALIALTTLATVIGMRRTIGAMWVGTVLKLSPILLLTIYGLATTGVPAGVSLPEFSQVESIAILLAYAFSGVGLSAISAGETKAPTTTIYRSIFLSLGFVAVLYAMIQLAYAGTAIPQADSDIPLAAMGEALFGQAGITMISLAAIFSIATNQLAGFLVIPRVLFGMGRRGLLPPVFAHVSPRFQTPSMAIVFFGSVVAALAASGTFADLATMLVASEQIFIIACILALIILWQRGEGRVAQSMGVRWYAIIAVAGIGTIWMTLQVPLDAALSTGMLAGVGTLLYVLARAGTREGEATRFVG